MDKLKVNWIPVTIITLLLVSSVLAVVLAVLNRGNQTVLTATGTLAAAVAFYIINLLSSLSEIKPAPVSFAVEITVDRSTNFIGARVYSLEQSMRAFVEKDVMQKLIAAHSDIIAQQEDTVRRDFIVVSMLQWLSSQEFDWQSEARVLKTSRGTISMKGITSRPDQSVVVREGNLRDMLATEGNLFASQFAMNTFKEIYLPKGSKFLLSSNTIEIAHPVFDLKIELEEPAKSTLNTSPLTGRMEMMPNGRPRFSQYVYGATFRTKVEKFRSGSIDRPRLEIWFSRLRKGLCQWFEVPSLSENQTNIPVGELVMTLPK